VPLCLKSNSEETCLRIGGHTGSCNSFPSVWNEIEHDPLDKTKKKIVKAGFATPRGGDKGGYQNHVSRSSRVIIPFEHATRVSFLNYDQGAVVRITIPQAIELFDNDLLHEGNEYLEVEIGEERQRAFLLYRSTEEMKTLPIRKNWVPCGHRIDGLESARRSVSGEDFGQYLARVPRGLSAGIQQGIFAPEYVGKRENYACQVFLTFLAYRTQGHELDVNYYHIQEILEYLNLFEIEKFRLKAILNDNDETICPLCMRPIEFSELHEAIDPSQVPGLANSGVQLAETRSTLVNLFHLQPLLYEKVLGHNVNNVAWGHAHCNTFLAQRRSYSLQELKLRGSLITQDLYWDLDGLFIRSEDHRAWVSVTPIESGDETFTSYLKRIGVISAISEEDEP
jgi:hypothetical protein